MYWADARPAEWRSRDGGGDGALRAREDAHVPRPVRGRQGDVLHQLLGVEPLGIRLVADLEHDGVLVDAVAVHVTAEELTAVQTSRDRDRDLGAGERRLPQERLLPAQLLRRHLRAVRQLERDGVPVVRNDELELDEIRALV